MTAAMSFAFFQCWRSRRHDFFVFMLMRRCQISRRIRLPKCPAETPFTSTTLSPAGLDVAHVRNATSQA
jgi:hypothetical protein